MENQQSFWQFSDQLRLQNEEPSNRWRLGSSYLNSFANLSINENVWSNSNKADDVSNTNNWSNSNKGNNSVSNVGINDSVWGNSNSNKWNKEETRRNVDMKEGKVKHKSSDQNGFNVGWKSGGTGSYVGKGIINNNGSNNKGYENLKNKNNSNGNSGSSKNKRGNSIVDKRFKTLPASESLPRTETLGGYIFVCNNDTMEDDLRRQLFGLPQRYRDSVRAITPGLPLFLYNYSTHQLHGVFEAASFGGTNIDPTAWEDKKCPGESRFPAQVRVITRKSCEPLEEDSFRPVLHHYDGPKFRLQLNIPEALALLDIFDNNKPSLTPRQ